ncbi:MAG: DUF1015 domain-containing protein [bacterium]
MPFRGITFNTGKVALDSAVAPPYDVLSAADAGQFQARSEYNIGNVDFRSPEEGDGRYAAAARLMDEWLERGILLRDEKPAIYLIECEFRDGNGRTVRRKSFTALLRLEDLGTGTVFPHEKTFPKQKQDRLKLLRATNAHFNPVFALYSDPDGEAKAVLNSVVASRPAELSVEDFDGVAHRLWRITREKSLTRLKRVLHNSNVFIADGHHRYETALNYAKEMRSRCESFQGDEAFNYVMMAFVQMEDEGLKILPAHRMLRGIPGYSESKVMERLRENFSIESAPREEMLTSLNGRSTGDHTFGLQIGGACYRLKLKDDADLASAMPGMSRRWRNLDVSIAQSLIINPLLGGEEKDQFGRINYEVDVDKVSRKVSTGEYQLALFIEPTRTSQLIDVTTARELMPHKSTYFHPKMLTGFIMNRFSPDERVGGAEK